MAPCRILIYPPAHTDQHVTDPRFSRARQRRWRLRAAARSLDPRRVLAGAGEISFIVRPPHLGAQSNISAP
jgi:hypothetical protein